MSVSSISIADSGGTARLVAARNLSSVFYQMTEPEVSTYHRVAAGSGDAVNISATAAVLRAVRVFNKGSVPAYVKFHNAAGSPTPGSSVSYTVACQAGTGNPDPRLSGGGRQFSTGLAMTIVTGLDDTDANGVTAGSVLVEVEYHAA